MELDRAVYGAKEITLLCSPQKMHRFRRNEDRKNQWCINAFRKWQLRMLQRILLHTVNITFTDNYVTAFHFTHTY